MYTIPLFKRLCTVRMYNSGCSLYLCIGDCLLLLFPWEFALYLCIIYKRMYKRICTVFLHEKKMKCTYVHRTYVQDKETPHVSAVFLSLQHIRHSSLRVVWYYILSWQAEALLIVMPPTSRQALTRPVMGMTKGPHVMPAILLTPPPSLPLWSFLGCLTASV